MRITCPACSATLEVPPGFAGPKVRCSSCRAVVDVPAENVPEAQLVPALPPPPPPRRPERRPRRDREPEQAGLNWPLILGGGGAALVILLVLLTGAALVVFSPAPTPGGPFGKAGPRPPFNDKAWRDDFDRPLPPPPEEERPDPVLRRPALGVAFTDGKFTARLALEEAAFPPGVSQIVQPLEFTARAGAVYHVEARDNPRVHVKVDGPAGEVAAPRDRFERNRPRVAFAAVAGKHVVTVTGDRFGAGACELAIRELGDGDALPLDQRLPASATTPTLTVSQKMGTAREKRLTAAAFAPDSKRFYAAHADGSLSCWSHPANERLATFDAKKAIDEIAVDGRGRVFMRATKWERSPRRPGTPRPAGPLLVWDALDPKGGPYPEPSHTLPVDADIARLITSRDGLWVYALDAGRNKLLRIGGDTPKVEKGATLGPGVTSFCQTPDGKKLYACASSNRIDEIDAATFKLVRSVRFTAGQPSDIAATNAGVCYLAGKSEGRFGDYGLVVDVGRTKGEAAGAAGLGIRCHTRFAVMMPDEGMVILSGDRRLNLCTVTDRPTVFRTGHRESNYDGYSTPARAWASPDGKTVLWDHGHILTVGR